MFPRRSFLILATATLLAPRAFAVGLEIPLFDLHPAWEKHGIAAGKFKFDGHWNADGHRWSADAIFEYLQSQKLVGNQGRK